jgi:hypothetical protein
LTKEVGRMIGHYDPLKGERFEVLDEKGRVKKSWKLELVDSELKKIYGLMVATRAASPFTPPIISEARLATTSLMFIWNDVPAPIWKTSTTN